VEVEHPFEVGDPVGAAAAPYVLDHAEIAQAGQRRRMGIGPGDGLEVDVVDGELLPPVDKVEAAAARTMDGRDVQFHGLGLAGRGPGPQLDAARMRLQGVLHAQRHGRDHGLPVGGGLGQRVGGARIDHQVHAALPVQRHLARAVPRHGAKSQPLQHLAQGLGLAGRVLDELYAVDPEAIGRLGHVFPAAGGGIGHCGTPAGNMIVVQRPSGIAL
jgi:hypothetical protein